MSGGGGGGGSSTTVQSIPDELKPLATAYTKKAINLGNTGFTPYDGQRYADLNGTQYAGIGKIANRAVSGSPIMGAANSALTNMLTQDTTNPYLNNMVDQAQQSVIRNYNNSVVPATQAAMRQSGSFGNSGLQQLQLQQQSDLQRNLGDISTNMYGNAYNTNQANKMGALGMAQSYGNQDYQDAAQLLNAGQILQDQNQNNLDFRYQQYQDAQNDPYKKLAAMSGVFGSNLGSTSTTTQSGGGK